MTAGNLPLSEGELKLTAALYALRPGVLDYVRENGELPKRIPSGGGHIGIRQLIKNRGTDVELTEDEELVLKAIVRSGRLPGGYAILVNEEGRPL